MHSRGPAEWYAPSALPRSSLLSGDRLPDLQLPASPPSRVGSFDSTAGAYPPSLTSNASSYPGLDPKTPSPSEGSSPQHHPHAGSYQYSLPQVKKEVGGGHQYYPVTSGVQGASGSYRPSGGSSAMNQPSQYLDSHPHMTTGGSYAALSQTTGAGAMSHYPQYPQQTNMPSAGSGAYAPTGSSYGGYYSGVTSPQSASGSTPASMGLGQSLPSMSMTSSFRMHESSEK